MKNLVFVVFGDITFYETPELKAVVNRVDNVSLVKQSDLDSVCERSLDMFESYLVVSEYNGVIENVELINIYCNHH